MSPPRDNKRSDYANSKGTQPKSRSPSRCCFLKKSDSWDLNGPLSSLRSLQREGDQGRVPQGRKSRYRFLPARTLLHAFGPHSIDWHRNVMVGPLSMLLPHLVCLQSSLWFTSLSFFLTCPHLLFTRLGHNTHEQIKTITSWS